MKKILLFFVPILIFSCKKDNSNINIPKDYKIIEAVITRPNNKDYKSKIKFDYNSNGKLRQIVHSSKEYEFKETYQYQMGRLSKISYLNSNPSLNGNKIFEYNDKGYLRSLTIERMVKNKNDSTLTMTKTATKEFTYKKNEIKIVTKSSSDNPTVKKEIMTLDGDGKFLNLKNVNNSKTDKTYDKKNSINDLIFDKSLIGYELYGRGNLLSLGDKISNTYEYNELVFPTEKRTFYDGKLQSITKYYYNK
ncbi:hypothetical protein [Polaribacter sp. Asnod1-A03]|uniref:hypothetical protein n=1 Tax=Polaribacter sp. Asnod1-A03 TaxID=3160581 RepID=UPI0038693325